MVLNAQAFPPFRRRTPHLVEIGRGLDQPIVVFAAGHSGAGTRWAADLDEELPASWGVCAFLLPGRESRARERFAPDVRSLVDCLVGEIRGLSLGQRKVLLYGQSLGALLAFEVSRALEASGGVVPLGLAVLGAPGPCTRPPRAERASDAELVDELRSLGETPEIALLDAALRERILETVRNDMRLFDEFPWGTSATVAAPIVALRGAHDASVTAAAAKRWLDSSSSPASRFEEVTGRHLPTRAAARLWCPLLENLVLT